MARIDLTRRAEIGREKRARTRAQLLEGAKSLLAERPLAAITIDDIVAASGVAKGTFYYHFKDIVELAGAVARELAVDFDELIRPHRVAFDNPLERVGFGLLSFLGKAEENYRWGRLVLNGVPASLELRHSVRQNLVADLSAAKRAGQLGVDDVELAADLVIGIWRAVTRGITDGRLGPGTVDATCVAAMRTLGLARSEAVALMARVRNKVRKKRTIVASVKHPSA
jgi:AcrR family transcriptional regulator